MQNLNVINCHSRMQTVTGRIEDIPRRKIQPTIMLDVPIRQKKGASGGLVENRQSRL
jgi:hypothetical protein